jgi:L-alanine-DL-glutamate epimerase-like enolase superfamily enzyme
MKVKKIELVHVDIPFTTHANRFLQYWIHPWRISQVCKLTMDNKVVGWGETIPNYTWARVPEDIEQRVLNRPAAELMWDDGLGAGVQMALFDAVAKAQEVPVHRLLGTKVRDWCPISWWNGDMPGEDWAEECRQAVEAGYMSAKLKARPWFDVAANVRKISKVVPEGFHLDLDYNGALGDSAGAVPHLKELEAFEHVAVVETPIPQGDIAGNIQIRRHFSRPIAMHYGSPPVLTALKEDVADGFVLCAGASRLHRQAAICEEANKPFWLQLVGTDITTAWAAHLGAVLPQARWPAITCTNIYKRQLVKKRLRVRGGYHRVPERVGIGVEIDEAAIERHRTTHTTRDIPRHLCRYVRAGGEVTVYACGKPALERVYTQDAQPICERGSALKILPDDGSRSFSELYEKASEAPVRQKKKRQKD